MLPPLLIFYLVGCAHPREDQLRRFMGENQAFRELPPGPERVDALYNHAVAITGSPLNGLELLATMAANDGILLADAFDFGLTADGPLSPPDKTGHFFSHAWWRYQDEYRPFPIAASNEQVWEVLGEIKSWTFSGDGYDWNDIWANRLGWEFAQRIRRYRLYQGPPIKPSDIIAEAQHFRPPGDQNDEDNR